VAADRDPIEVTLDGFCAAFLHQGLGCLIAERWQGRERYQAKVCSGDPAQAQTRSMIVTMFRVLILPRSYLRA